MTEAIASTPAEPDGAPRIEVLDILRGLAILGILFMNINDMGQSFEASGSDIRHLGWGPADQIVWWIREIFGNGTARALLEMLFGAGMVILTERAAAAAEGRWTVMRQYYVRNIVLFLFGVAHMLILLWPGDILHTYGLAALIVFLFRRLRPRWLIPIGLLLATLQLFAGGYFAYYQPLQTQAQVARIEARQQAGQAISAGDRALLTKTARERREHAQHEAENGRTIAAEDRARGPDGNFHSWAAHQWRVTFERAEAEIFFVLEAATTMLIGCALFKLGILQGRRSRRFYLAMTLIGYAIGIAVRAWGAWETSRFVDGPMLIHVTSEYARLAVTLGHVGLVNLLVMSAAGERALRPLVAAGRTALTIYIVQTLICLWILFPPFALGLYGQWSWAPLMLAALVIDLVLLWAANVYLRHYRIAPVEWAWRSLVEWRALPFRKAPRAAAT
ncbi:MAG: uncharacterized protein QOI38_1124 [Sphingomonadales bacterium]|jgi:uncharacterized protein|nr:uncharacterized protein [Sphingomonadales bacterium]